MEEVAIGVLGYGTVGQGVVEILRDNADEIAARCGKRLKVVRVARRSWAGIDTSALDFACSTDLLATATAPEVEIVIELIGGLEPAKTAIHRALAAGKPVITANKALIAQQSEDLLALAARHGLPLVFEASVAGGIPIVKILREAMSGNRIEQVAGIINGTTNFILSEMKDKGRGFAEALAEAQALGYAEADPTFDVEGIDAAHKITILAALAFGLPLHFEKTYVEGISEVEPLDIRIADELGYTIKHLGMAIRKAQGIEIRVHPTLIPKSSLLSHVRGVMNAVCIDGNAIGHSLYYGPGAGKRPTASAVVADLIDVVRGQAATPPLGFSNPHPQPVLETGAYESAYYLRALVEDKSGVLAEVTKIFARHKISIRSMIQQNALKNDDCVPLVFLTERVAEALIVQALGEIAALPVVRGALRRIRVEDIA